MSSYSSDVLVEIPPARSPLLLPSDRLRQRQSSTEPIFYHANSYRADRDPLDDLEFLAPSSGSWDGRGEDDESEDELSDDESIEDFSLEDGHIQGVPCANMRMDAKHYHQADFAMALLELLRDDLRIPGWANLPRDLPASLIHIHKVSGSLTNAVFFVSIPGEDFDVSGAGTATPQLSSSTLRAVNLADLDRLTSPTPGTPTLSSSSPSNQLHTVHIEAPTLLLRIYGPSSGALISRKTELHILHTLSSAYAIGPRVLGTFSNGRVEEYFHSRALHKDEMRDARISRWIGRRMRELHRVPLEMLEVPGGDEGSSSSRNSSGTREERPSLDPMGGQRGSGSGGGGSGGSIYSTSSGSSVFSFGTSTYSTSSSGGSISGRSEFGTPLVLSPMLLPRRGSSESRAERKKRPSASSIMSSRSRRTSRDKLGVWENITRWTREAKLVLKELDSLAAMPGFAAFLGPTPAPSSATSTTLHDERHVTPLDSAALTLSLRAELNLPLFEQQVKLYRAFVRDWEKNEGKSKRVFSHNDTQYGNLLLLTPEDESEERALERSLQAPHQKIIVVDFEYASANPRGFDIANHFIEWQADYHHPALSHSLAAHAGYPSASERSRFLRAYVGCDGGADASTSSAVEGDEDPRVARLEREVQVWEPSSHAMWAVWGIVQAKEDLLFKVAKWKKACERSHREASAGVEEGVARMGISGDEKKPRLTRGKSGETIAGENGEEEGEDPAADFDYLSYSLGRMQLFREELKALKVVE
ncbi:hypothetical protein RQP46_001930 [Phenoliferia psychrophenolica]